MLLHPHARAYRNIRTDKELYFDQFLEWDKNGFHRSLIDEDYIIQLTTHPNFEAESKLVQYFQKHGDHFQNVTESDAIINGYRQANSFKNFKTEKGVGHSKGLYYELNLYSASIRYSNHHTSSTTGSTFVRDSSHDINQVQTKGPHWTVEEVKADVTSYAHTSKTIN